MGRYLNPGNEKFREALNSEIYVDKTGLLSYTNGRIGKARRYICVSRPRRFGKSYAADMLAAYYSRGCDSRALFEGLNAAEDPSFEKHLNKYDVFLIDMSDVMDGAKDIRAALENLEEGMCEDLKEAYPDIGFRRDDDVYHMLNTVYQETGMDFVFIMDEYDAPIRERPDDDKGQRIYLDFLTCLLKDEVYVGLAYVTGILPVKKMSQSGPNMFDEYGMTFSGRMDGFFGFTEDEVRSLCGKYHRSYDEIKSRYYGYRTGDVTVYSPGQVVRALTDGRAGPEGRSGPYEDIAGYLVNDECGMQGALMPLIAGKEVDVSTLCFPNDTVHLCIRDDVMTLLIHLGYLTYDRRTEKARIPNLETRGLFVEAAERAGLGNCDEAMPDSERVIEATLKGDEREVTRILEKMEAERRTGRRRGGEVPLRYEAGFAYLAAGERYDVDFGYISREDGYADVWFIPLDPGDQTFPPMVVEVKTKADTRGGVANALDGRYPYRLSDYRGEVVLVEIHRGAKAGKRVCKIRRVVKE